jgi:hypothetical protein
MFARVTKVITVIRRIGREYVSIFQDSYLGSAAFCKKMGLERNCIFIDVDRGGAAHLFIRFARSSLVYVSPLLLGDKDAG